MVTLDVADDGRAGRGDESSLGILLDQRAVAIGDEIGSEATSCTIANPIARSIPTSVVYPMSRNSAGKLGARQAPTRAPEASSASTSSIELRTCFAFCLQTTTQLPQPMQRSAITAAWPSAMRIALAGHSRTHV